MSTVTADTPIVAPAAGRVDSLATGMAFMLVMNIVQRGVGFARGLLFCRFLGEEALGLFSLSSSFLLLAAPLVVLGLPGSLGRYVEHYRQRGQLQAYLRKLTLVTLALTGIGVLVMQAFARPLAYLLFDDASRVRLLMWSLAVLALVVIFNYLNELLTAIRQVRALSWMQFVNSLTFTVAGLALVIGWESSAEALTIAYAISCVAAIVAILPWQREIRAEFSHDRGALPTSDAWRKLLPFAAWVWLTNMVANVADLVDRFMILHFSGLDSHAAQALVGQYHSARIVPLLLATLAATLAAIVLPHWSQAWETNQRPKVGAQMQLTVKLLAVLFALGSLLVLLCSPVLFGWLLQGSYDDGLAALPWALIGAIWFGMFILGQNYLLCAERARLVTTACVIGVAINIALNFAALPLGLAAVMAARAMATLATILVVTAFSLRYGFTWRRGYSIALLLPLVILAGPRLGMALLLAVVIFDWRFRWLFDAEEERQLADLFRRSVGKITQKWMATER